VTDTLCREAVDVRGAAPVVTGIKMGHSIEESVLMQDGERSPDGPGVACRDRAGFDIMVLPDCRNRKGEIDGRCLNGSRLGVE